MLDLKGQLDSSNIMSFFRFIVCYNCQHFYNHTKLHVNKIKKGKVPCLLSVIGFSLKLVFNLTKHPALL